MAEQQAITGDDVLEKLRYMFLQMSWEQQNPESL